MDYSGCDLRNLVFLWPGQHIDQRRVDVLYLHLKTALTEFFGIPIGIPSSKMAVSWEFPGIPIQGGSLQLQGVIFVTSHGKSLVFLVRRTAQCKILAH